MDVVLNNGRDRANEVLSFGRGYSADPADSVADLETRCFAHGVSLRESGIEILAMAEYAG